ncbi:hypothetical protein ACFE04_018895 [Oxalis oulophora]
MVSAFTKSLFFFLFSATLLLSMFITTGQAQCTLNDFTIGTVRTNQLVQGKSEWNVTVINTCDCGVQQIWLNCKGFQTVEPIDPKTLSKQGDRCLLIDGDLLPSQTSVSFAYAWDPPFLLSPAETTSVC